MRSFLFSLPVVLLAACSSTITPLETPPDFFVQSEEMEGQVPDGFKDVEVEVPMSLLMAIGKAETGLQMVIGEEEFEGKHPGYGIMGLRSEHLALATELTGLTEDAIMFERNANITAAAAVLDRFADQIGIGDRTLLGNWAPVVARYSGIETQEALAEYVHFQVYETIEEGIEVEGFSVKGQDVDVDWPAPKARSARITGDGGAIYSSSPNQSSRSGYTPKTVIIHTCEGSYSGCWGWLVNSASGVSAHYVVNDDGSEVRQLVDEDKKAWHIGASWDCSLNDSVNCSYNGMSSNTITVGIEHAGYGSQSSWSSGLIQRSADLTCGITQRHGIPRDDNHIIGHGQMQPWSRTDPGPNWPWTDYIYKVQDACGDHGSNNNPPPAPTTPTTPAPTTPAPTTPPPSTGTQPSFTIDSNNAANNTSTHELRVSGNWWASANVSGYYNTGYWVAPTASIADAAWFDFKIDGTQCYSVEAWWTSAGDRPTGVAYIGFDNSLNEVGRTTVNQQISGGQWNHLGNWDFTAGWNSVALSRWTTSGYYAVADAVRLTPTTGCQ